MRTLLQTHATPSTSSVMVSVDSVSSRDSIKSTAGDLFQNDPDVSVYSLSCSVEMRPEEQTHPGVNMDKKISNQLSGIIF
jgi:hypothetical protein